MMENENLYDIFSVDSKNVGHNLWRTSENTFKIIEYRNFSPVLYGFDYTLVDDSLISAFEFLLKEEVEIKKIIIKRFATNEEWNNYNELVIKEHIMPEKKQVLNGTVGNIWQFDHTIFVSEKMKNKLEMLAEDKLEFHHGFILYGGD